jgi:hypothetical protein
MNNNILAVIKKNKLLGCIIIIFVLSIYIIITGKIIFYNNSILIIYAEKAIYKRDIESNKKYKYKEGKAITLKPLTINTVLGNIYLEHFDKILYYKFPKKLGWSDSPSTQIEINENYIKHDLMLFGEKITPFEYVIIMSFGNLRIKNVQMNKIIDGYERKIIEIWYNAENEIIELELATAIPPEYVSFTLDGEIIK